MIGNESKRIVVELSTSNETQTPEGYTVHLPAPYGGILSFEKSVPTDGPIAYLFSKTTEETDQSNIPPEERVSPERMAEIARQGVVDDDGSAVFMPAKGSVVLLVLNALAKFSPGETIDVAFRFPQQLGRLGINS